MVSENRKINIFFDRGYDDSIFRAWTEKNGYRLVLTSGPLEADFRSAWDEHLDINAMGIWVGYPVESTLDIDVVQQFIRAMAETLEPLYYCVRPNEHLQIERAQLAGVPKMEPFAREPSWLSRRSKQVARRLGYESFFSGSSKSKTFYEKTMAQRQLTILAGDVPVELPQNLLTWEAAWKSWKPGSESVSRDLIGRVERFFPYPKGIHVVVLNKCNLKCVMCPYHSPQYSSAHTNDYLKTKKEMSFDLFKGIADYAGQRGIALQFGQIEETLLHPYIFDFIEYAKGRGVPHIHLTTNGTLLSEERAKRLAVSGINSVMFSVDAATPELYKEIRGASLSVLERNIHYFLSIAKPKGIRVSVSFILQSQTKSERDAFLEKWQTLGVDQVVFYVLSRFDKSTGETIRENGSEHYEKGRRYPCASPWTQAVVFPEGEVSLCCKTLTDVGWRGVVSAGTLDSERRFENIWTGDSYRRVRTELLENSFRDFKVCQNCAIWSASTSLTDDTANYSRQYNETSETITFKILERNTYEKIDGRWSIAMPAQL